MSDLSLSRLRPVRLWLFAVAAMIFLTLIVGGATRLTESACRSPNGSRSPAWCRRCRSRHGRRSSTRYKQIPQYRELNRGMSLDAVQDDLLVGMDAPAAWRGWSAWRSCCRSCSSCGAAGSEAGAAMRGCGRIFGGGAALGAVGWWMVSSGLAGATASACRNTGWRSI